MNRRKIVGKVLHTRIVTQRAVLLSVKLIIFSAIFCIVGQPALAKQKGPKNCSQMAKFAFDARQKEVAADYSIAVGKCWNLPTKEETDDCIRDAKVEKKDGKEEARDQFDARNDFCDQLGEDPYDPVLNPADFVNPADIGGTVAPNPYWPLVPGYMWTYKNRDATDTVTETNTVEVTTDTVMIEGIECVVVHDVVYQGDTTDPEFLIEDTYDWYAQHTDGTVWYLGEFSVSREECDEVTGELCEGLYSDAGSWQAGFDGGKGGIVMFADPSDPSLPGRAYRQELYLGEAEDGAEVVSFNAESVTVPMGGGTTYDTDVLKTYEFSVLEPGAAENKYYAPGIGLLREEAIEDGVLTGERVELESKNF